GAGTTSFSYDALKRVTQKTRSDGVTRNFAYDALDALTLYTDADGAARRYTRDANGAVIGVSDALGGIASFTRSGNDLITGMIDTSGQSIRLGYDKLQRLASIQLQDASTLAFGYDAAGNRASFTDGEGNVWRREF